MATEKDSEQDRQIRENAVRITRNEEAIKRQTEALEKIRDHYYPPPAKWWKRTFAFCAKVVCVIVAYLSIAEAVDWMWKSHVADELAENYAKVGDRLYDKDGDILGAIACYEKAAKIDSQESEYLMRLTFLKGMELVSANLDRGRPPTDDEQERIGATLAEATFMKDLEPENPMPLVLMAQAYLAGGEKEEAVKSVEEAVARAPEKASVRVSACAINFFAGNVDKARSHLAEAARLEASLSLVTAWKGLFLLWVDHDATAARILFEKLVRRTPRLALAHLYLGLAILQEKDPDLARAREAFSRALVLNAKFTGAMLGQARICEREGKLVLARLWLDRALGVDGNYLPAFVARSRIAGMTGNTAAAISDLTEAIRLAPFRADLYRLRADAYEKVGDAARAKEDRAAAEELASADGQ